MHKITKLNKKFYVNTLKELPMIFPQYISQYTNIKLYCTFREREYYSDHNLYKVFNNFKKIEINYPCHIHSISILDIINFNAVTNFALLFNH